MSDLRELDSFDFVGGTTAVCDAILRLRGEALTLELGRLAGEVGELVRTQHDDRHEGDHGQLEEPDVEHA